MKNSPRNWGRFGWRVEVTRKARRANCSDSGSARLAENMTRGAHIALCPPGNLCTVRPFDRLSSGRLDQKTSEGYGVLQKGQWLISVGSDQIGDFTGDGGGVLLDGKL